MRNFDTDLADLDQLQISYGDALDRQDMSEWLAQFCDDPAASYICTTHEHEKRGLPLALMLDDCRGRIEDRVTYVTKVWAGTFQDYRTRHIMQRIQARHVAEDLVEMRTGFVVYCTPEESGITQILTAGEYEDVVRLDPAGPRFLSKKVILDTSVLSRYLVYPL